MEEVDCVVVGAGVIGLAVASALAKAGREVLVLERTDGIGRETSSRNSEVIHAGIYYRPGSLMARACVEGRERLYAFCRDHGVGAERIGKLIVATMPEEADRLGGIRDNAAQNGVADLRLLSGAETRVLEPALACHAALLSPSTGIIDSHAYMLALQGEAEAAGAAFVFRTEVLSGRISDNGPILCVGGDGGPLTLRARLVVNSAGLAAPALARGLEGFPAKHVPLARFARGNYFALQGRAPFTRLIYPVPVPGGLGIHLTLDLGGQARFGPDVEWLDQPDYTVDPARAAVFYPAIRRYWPGLPDGALVPAFAGVRPKIAAAGEPQADFVIQGPAVHGVPGLVNLFGIESPGLTSSLVLADLVAAAAG